MSHNYLIFLYYVITPKSEEPNNIGPAFKTVCRLLVLTGLACWPVGTIHADTVLPVIGTVAFEENLWGISINGKDQQESTVFIRDAGKRVWVAAKDLQRWRLRLPEVAPQDYQGEAFYPLDVPGSISYRVDEATQSIAIEAPVAMFLSTTHNSLTASLTPVASTLGGFFNYDGNVQYNQDKLLLGALSEVGVFNSWGIGTTTMVGKDLSADLLFYAWIVPGLQTCRHQ